MEYYAALIGDIVSSRDIPADDRRLIQRRLRSTLEELSQELGEALETGLQITGGDEFQGLFRDPSAIVDVYMGVWEEFPDLVFVYGIGGGGISTDLSDTITEVDGPCFHAARSALDRAKKEKKQVVVGGEGIAATKSIATAFHLLHRIRSGWTETQRRYALAARGLDTRGAVAEEFDVSQSAVSQGLQRAEFDLFMEAEEAARELLQLAFQVASLEESLAEPERAQGDG